MKRCTRLVLCLAILTLAFTGTVAADEDVTLEGSFVWARSDGDISGDLTAIMTPQGENEWSVAFHFVWEEEPHVYTGSATGSLTDGALEGRAINDNEERRMSFRFSGNVEGGTFTGTHGFVGDDGNVTEGGTLTLAQAAPATTDG